MQETTSGATVTVRFTEPLTESDYIAIWERLELGDWADNIEHVAEYVSLRVSWAHDATVLADAPTTFAARVKNVGESLGFEVAGIEATRHYWID